MLAFDHFTVGPLSCNCIIIWDKDTYDGFVIDPGGDSKDVINRVEKLGVRIISILHTHAHFDHIGATQELQKYWQCNAYIHKEDLIILNDTQYTTVFGFNAIAKPKVLTFSAKTLYKTLEILHTPGHTKGSCCFLGQIDSNTKILLSGDTLFNNSIGRTDLYGGSLEQLEHSIKNKLYILPDNTIVVPGHGQKTTIGKEANNNPYIKR